MTSEHEHSTPATHEISKFPRVNLWAEKLDAFHADAEQLLTKTMRAYHRSNVLLNPKRWKKVRSRDNLHVYRDRSVSNAYAPEMVCVGTMPGRLEDVLEGLNCETTREFCMMQAIISSRFLDGAVLKVIQRRSHDEPYSFTGIKWFAMHVPGGGLISNRDLCVFEKVGLVYDPDTKRRLGFKLFHSVDIPECPTLHGFVRMKANVCYVLEEIEPTVLGVYLTGSFDWNGSSMLSRVANPTIAYYLLRVGETSKCLRARKFTERSRSFKGPKSKKRRKCDICQEWNRSMFHSYESCWGCENSNVCRRCRQMEWMLAPELSPTDGIVQRPFCTSCVTHVESSSASKPRRHTDWPMHTFQLSDKKRGGMSVAATLIDEEFDHLDSFVSLEDDNDTSDSEECESDDWPDLDVKARSQSLSAFSLNVMSQLKEISVDGAEFSEESLVDESSHVIEASYDGTDNLEDSVLIEADDEFPILSRNSTEDWSSQVLSTRNPTVVPETTQLSTTARHQDMYQRILRANSIAEATLLVTREHAKVAKSMWERASSKYGHRL